MFETAEIGRKLSKKEHSSAVAELRPRLLAAQNDLHEAGIPAIILLNGVDGGGKGEFLHVLHEWLDARYLFTHAYAKPTEEERQRPEFWRFWMWLPPKGQTGVFIGSWYTRPLLERVNGKTNDEEYANELQRIVNFENTLKDDGTLFIKLWFHISKKEQRRRFRNFEKSKDTAWRVSKQDWRHHKQYDEFIDLSTKALRTTSTGAAPWTVIEGTDPRYRDVEAGRQILSCIEEAVARSQSASPPEAKPRDPVENPYTILDTLDLTQKLDKKTYDSRLTKAQGRLHRCGLKLQEKGKGAIFVFEGPDAAGKGGAIRRITYALDARWYRVIPISAPTDEEKAHHYLWRFWRQLPRLGRFTIYDRSWYGRVLVERVEGYASPGEWRRAYKEINDFEEQLVDANIVLLKFWLHISPDEQLKRFKKREKSPHKRYKITPEDYRNRSKNSEYELAATEMIERTSTEYAPWHLIAGDDKRFARVSVLETACDELESALT